MHFDATPTVKMNGKRRRVDQSAFGRFISIAMFSAASRGF